MQASKTPRPKPSNWPPQSSHTVLIRNLQLLELDQLEDWPGITLRTLSPLSQNQRHRIKAVEWVLYRLIALWDPETARDKLRPFFPALEPLQSVNLRAALFRVLTDYKKNGDLGRETILRKSMLDDCKGERFDELLATFSTGVLRKKKTENHNPAIDLALAPGLTPQEYPQLLPLILAHRVSLSTLGERRDRVRDTHEKFSQLLDKKKYEINARSTNGNRPGAIKESDLESLARKTRDNWQGNAEWADAILEGGLGSSRDAFLDLPFDKAWSRAKESTVDNLLTTSTRPDLVLDLETRVLQQRARLQKWHQYSASLRSSEAASPSKPKEAKKAPQLVFRDHQSLTVASISKAVRQPVDRSGPTPRDQDLLDSISEAMERINGSSTQRRNPPESIHEPEPESTREPEPEQKPSRSVPTISQPVFDPPIHPSTIDYTQEEPLSRRRKDPLTLAERTRKSMSMFEMITESPSSPEPLPSKYHPDPDPERGEEELRNESYTLAERTRKSMSLLPPPRDPPRQNLTRRSRKSRVSFPVNQFETPTKLSATPPDYPSRASTPRDDLFEDQADYASVFKSRPRIALSPVASPAVHVSPIGNFDLNGGHDDYVQDGEDLEYVAAESPSRTRRRF
ncbi:HAUS augmin-like complex subunit 6 N-terminus-domain-containing protein [Aspergillus venezuelensis]